MGTTAASADIVSRNPADPADEVGVFAPGGGIDVDRAVTAARSAQAGYAALPGQARADALNRAAARVEAAAGGLADLIRREVGKPIFEARGEVARTAAILRYQAQAALDPDGDTYPSADGRSLLFSRRRPRGVVALITPWNFPVAIPAWKLAPALAYGNVCVWKPSSFAPACAEALYECVAPELPDGALQIVQGRGDAGAALVGHAGVAAVSFTGSVETGRAVARMAAERGASAQCEMGGQNASIVLADADIEFAAATIAVAAMGYAGQKCTATSRVICAAPVPRPDARGAGGCGRRAAHRGSGRRRLPGGAADLGRGPRRRRGGGRAWGAGGRAAARRRRRPGRARKLPGADARRGRRRLGRARPGGGVRAGLRASCARTTPTPPSTLANGVRHGLVTAVFTRDLDRVIDLAGRLDTGLVRINQPTSGVDLHTPFGGEKESGLGPREQGKAAREFYTSLRTC